MLPTAARCSAGRRTFARRNGCAAVPKPRPPRPQQLLLLPCRARFFGGDGGSSHLCAAYCGGSQCVPARASCLSDCMLTVSGRLCGQVTAWNDLLEVGAFPAPKGSI